MSHEIKQNDKLVGTYKFWHGLNEVVPVIDRSNNPLLAWEAKPVKLTLESGKPTGFSILAGSDNGEAIGNPFNPKTYFPIGNTEFVKCVEDSLSKSGVNFEVQSAGSVRNRGRVFMAVALKDNADLEVDGRKFKSHLNFLNSFDKSCPFTVLDSNTCTVCDNTFSMNLSDDGGALSIRLVHKKNAVLAITDVPKMIDCALQGRVNFGRRLKHFSEFPCTPAQAEAIFAALVAKDENADLKTRSFNIVTRLAELFARGKGNKGQTVLDVFQAVTEYYTHESAGESEDKFKQFESSEFGAGAANKSEFFNALVKATVNADSFNGAARIGEKILIAYRNKPAKAAK